MHKQMRDKAKMRNWVGMAAIASSAALVSCSPGADMADKISVIEQDLETCAYFLSEPLSDIERARSLLNDAEQNCTKAQTGIISFREKYPREVELHSRINELVSSNFETDLDVVLRDIRNKKNFYYSAEGEKSFLEEELRISDPFPFTAILNCSMTAFENSGIPLISCMSNGRSSGTLRIRSGDSLQVLQGWQLQNSTEYVMTERSLEIPLPSKFSIKIENQQENLLLSMKIVDNDGNNLYQGVAEKYETLEYEQYEND